MNDQILELAIAYAEAEEPIELGVTLVVGGLLIAGNVISFEKYLASDPITEAMDRAMKQVREKRGEKVPRDDGVRRYIHLRDARYFSPGQQPAPTDGHVTCRVRLDSVAAFHMGVLGMLEDE
jgi:hypothetical protein